MAQRRLVPPTGFYDPALDAQRGSASRGLGYLEQDTELAGARAAQDYTFGTEDLRRGLDRTNFDLAQQRDRGYADLDTQLSRGTQDYDRSITGLTRSYQQLGRRQAEGSRAAGVLSGGMALKAAAVRAQNQAIDREPLDTSFRRMGEDIGRDRTRLGEDIDTAGGRAYQDWNIGTGRLGVDYNRGVTDRATTLGRAGDENTQFGLDLDAQRLFQATQAGWVPPKNPGTPAGKYSPGGVGAGASGLAPGGRLADWFNPFRKRT